MAGTAEKEEGGKKKPKKLSSASNQLCHICDDLIDFQDSCLQQTESNQPTEKLSAWRQKKKKSREEKLEHQES